MNIYLTMIMTPSRISLFIHLHSELCSQYNKYLKQQQIKNNQLLQKTLFYHVHILIQLRTPKNIYSLVS